jgi:hypothetical protein
VVENWSTIQFETIDHGKDIDILVLASDHLLLAAYQRDFNLRSVSRNTSGLEETVSSWDFRMAEAGKSRRVQSARRFGSPEERR